jgi:hypothetical protein
MSAKIKNDQLLAYLFDDKPHRLTTPLANWINASRRYKEFAHEYRDKIRKKIRITNSDSAVLDLTAELETAYQLLQQKKFNVVYEPYGSEKGRGPDFAVTFKSQTFNIEVTRIDPSHMELSGSPPAYDPQQAAIRLMDTICDKLGQMRPGMSNLLLIVTDSTFYAALDVEQAMVELKDRVERKEEGLFGRYRYEKPADFFKYYLRLSAIFTRTPAAKQSKIESALWLNNQAKHPLIGRRQTLLQRPSRSPG